MMTEQHVDHKGNPITMQDIRLVSGEGKLSKKTIKQAVGIIKRQRKEHDDRLIQGLDFIVKVGYSGNMMRKGNVMNTTANMTDADLTQFLVEDAIPQDIGNARMAYAAGYFESTLLSLMARFPEVRKEIEDRVNFRKGEAK